MKHVFIAFLVICLSVPGFKALYETFIMHHHFGLMQFFSVYGSCFLIAFTLLIHIVYHRKKK